MRQLMIQSALGLVLIGLSMPTSAQTSSSVNTGVNTGPGAAATVGSPVIDNQTTAPARPPVMNPVGTDIGVGGTTTINGNGLGVNTGIHSTTTTSPRRITVPNTPSTPTGENSVGGRIDLNTSGTTTSPSTSGPTGGR